MTTPDRRAALLVLQASIAAELATLPAPAAEPARPLYLSPGAFADELGVHPSTVRRMLGEGLPHLRPRPRLIRIPVADARRWMEARAARSLPAVAAHRGELQ